MLRKNFLYRLLFRDVLVARVYKSSFIAYCFFFHMYALHMSVINKEATYLLIMREVASFGALSLFGNRTIRGHTNSRSVKSRTGQLTD